MVTVRFMALTGKFRTVRTAVFPSMAEATTAVVAHATEGRFTDVKRVDDEGDMSVRFTARTPGGRSGRNVAFADHDGECGDLNHGAMCRCKVTGVVACDNDAHQAGCQHCVDGIVLVGTDVGSAWPEND